ncbi:hypothetical protein [Enterovibrio norvegicus]|uniref:hypothetical protein n=1 Tax=Enterovibrio norvegicus TaxID=188144 RepID=UPI0011396833|nr:hypothetical protein [Enterovibrio norvegicus]TKF32237.1 hypothetical protein FCV83_13980 [Enterovibrio norvegicus]
MQFERGHMMSERKMICAFSSDSRELYKADVFRSINLPKGHVVHFRYKGKYVEDELLRKDVKWWEGKEAVIFFTKGNSLEKSDSKPENIAIRKATIVSFSYDLEKTDVCHLYMKLSDFCRASIPSSTQHTNQPNSKFLSELPLEKFDVVTWKDCIESVSDSFQGKVFTHIVGLKTHKAEDVSLKYDKGTKTSYYELVQGERYTMEMATGNPDVNSCKTELSRSSDEVNFHCITPIETTVQYDLKQIPLSVKKLDSRKAYSTINLCPVTTSIQYRKEETKEYREFSTQIEIRSRQSRTASVMFGFASALLVAGLGLGRVAVKDPISWLLGLVALGLVIVSASLLHHFFNKK